MENCMTMRGHSQRKMSCGFTKIFDCGSRKTEEFYLSFNQLNRGHFPTMRQFVLQTLWKWTAFCCHDFIRKWSLLTCSVKAAPSKVETIERGTRHETKNFKALRHEANVGLHFTISHFGKSLLENNKIQVLASTIFGRLKTEKSRSLPHEFPRPKERTVFHTWSLRN